jgi:very-short-patch-repair endonuclease
LVSLETKLETWKNKLLDLGKRNNLLNYRDTRRSNLRIKTPQIFELWDSIVLTEEPLVFPQPEDVIPGEDDDLAETHLENGSVVTNQSVKDQQKTLYNIRNKAKTAIEEQGINVLYLSFGFVRWTESENSDQAFDAPLILVPVALKLESITSPFVLTLHEDEIVVNPTLIYKFDNDYGIKLPEFDTEDSLSEYFSQVSEIISKSHWEIIPEVGLGLLSFLKINMYRDLEKHKEKILKNLVVCALGGDATALQYDLSEIENVDHDTRISPTAVFQVVDADSSQQDAILCARKGISFVLQGPPGTGKSQTITNIIAECLADGKKVLFVSEKMAALDVVHKRLSKVGLADFCFILHSYKANKKDTLAQLGNVLNLADRKASLNDDAFQKLDLLMSDREKLNAYAVEIHKSIQPLNKTIYQVNGYLANLQGYDEIIFAVENVEKISQQDFDRLINTLNRFVNTIGKMSNSFKANPWRGTCVQIVTNELRHDMGAYLNILLPKIKVATVLSDEIASEFHFDFNTSVNGLNRIVDFLALAGFSPKVPKSWILEEDIASLFGEIEECAKLQAKYSELRQQIQLLCSEIATLDKTSTFTSGEAFADAMQIRQYIDTLHSHIAYSPYYCAWAGKENIDQIQSLFASTKEKIKDYRSSCALVLGEYEKEIFDIDYNQIYHRFKVNCSSVFKIFNRQYKDDKRQIQGLHKDIVKKIRDEAVLQVLGQLRHIDELKSWMNEMSGLLSATFPTLYDGEKTNFEALQKAVDAYCLIKRCLQLLKQLGEIAESSTMKESVLRSHYEFLYNGMSTDWNAVRSALDWAKKFRDKADAFACGKDYLTAVCSDFETIHKSEGYSKKIINILTDMDTEFSWYTKLFENDEELLSTNMSALYDRVMACVNGLALLEEWIDFRTARKDCCDHGLGDYVAKIEEMQIPVEKIIPIFKRRFYRLWLDKILPDYPSVANFRRRVQETTISEFAALDKLQFEIAKARIRSKLINDLPSMNHFTNGTDEISVLKRELNKQRRIMPIRKLFKEIPNLILTLKPCLMMSPLSVSLFLEADSFDFDTVIFDEASQVCTENAVGAISRGKQVIITGDSKQLPPTNFFSATTSNAEFDVDDNEDEFDDADAFESILDEAALLPERTLLWHYRSRHEHLIAYSNAKIYKNNLITFPSNIDKVADNGVEYVYVSEGFYDRGGRKGNTIEAEKVAEMVFEHFEKFPERSLGVIAFGEVQQQAIETSINQKRRENQAYEEFFNEDRSEAFFTKNIENVQGDERDTIIFSIGYAKDASGKMHMNFGPLSKSGGERRLNVAITRAKYNVKLVGSVMPTDIEIERINAEGPKLLRGYIDFAIHGPSVLANEITDSDIVEHDSPFESAVYNFLDRKGYRLGTQVGCSGYRIDMAVKHPTLSGRYVLGIECDGATYHSARTARERDRLRQSVLEDMGWKIYRIWSTDWIKDPTTEGERLIEAVDKAISEYVEDIPIPQKTADDAEPSTFLSVEKKEITVSQAENPYGFTTPKTTNFGSLPRDRNGYLQMTDCIELLVMNEYPIHYDLLCQKLASLLGRDKATSVVRREVDYALQRLRTRVVQKGDFFYPAGYSEIPARKLDNRQIKHISADELVSAMYTIVGNCIGTTREALIVETVRAYGFARSGSSITGAMNEAYEQLLAEGKIHEVDGKLLITA